MKELNGTLALIPTPLTDEGKIDEEGIHKIIDYDIENGCKGIGVLAAIGEGYLLASKDIEQVVRTAAKALAGRGSLVVGCPGMGTNSAVDACRRAEDYGADAILAFNPKYKGFDPYVFEHLVPHYSAMADAVDIPLVPYSQLDDPIPLDVLKYLVENEKIRHIKYGPHDCEVLKKTIAELGDKLFIFAGADTFILRHLMLGANGVSIATAAIFPKEVSDLVKLANEKELEKAREIYRKTVIYWNDLGFYNCWQSVHKIALKALGLIDSVKCFAPLTDAEDYQEEEILSLMKYLGKID